MPAQKRHRSPQDDTEESPPPRSPPPSPGQQHEQQEDQQQQGGGAEHAAPQPELTREQEPAEAEKDDSDDEDDSPPSPASSGKPRFVLVRLTDVRKEVQCPICLGIIRKTRTVMECLHRFCRECIDKSMRLGNNECPACRTHCASRRSLRDDPNYDNLIAILYPDIDKYEKEELALHEEEKMRNRKIQASIAETHRRQSEALGRRRSTAKATATAFPRRSHGNFRNAHGQSSYFRGRVRSGTRNASIGGSDDEEEDDDVNGNDGGKDSSSAEEQSPDVRPKRCRRWAPPRSSPARIAGNAEIGSEENDDTEVSRENLGTSPFRAGNREMLAWGKGGARSQTRHGNASASNGRFVKGGRITKLVEYLRNLDENDDEFDVHCTVLPLNEQSVPHLQRPHLCSPSTLTIGQLSEFIALETQCCLPSEVEIFVRRPEDGTLSTKPSCEVDQVQSAPSKELQILTAEETLADLYASLTANQGGLLLLYKFKITETEMK